MRKPFLLPLMLLAGTALASEPIPLPFEGLYESRGSFAREQLAPDEWREIPQDVQMYITRDAGVVEVSLRIEAQSTEAGAGPASYTIANDMWLVPKPDQTSDPDSGRTVFDVYKRDPSTGRLEDRGDGYCQDRECRYSYVTTKPDHQQRYHSHITWRPDEAEMAFAQSGGLSIKPEGENEWTTFKTWENRFTRSR